MSGGTRAGTLVAWGAPVFHSSECLDGREAITQTDIGAQVIRFQDQTDSNALRTTVRLWAKHGIFGN
jgi:hypothetical protein